MNQSNICVTYINDRQYEKEMRRMSLEYLSNELLLDLFEYFDGYDILNSFYGLNARFNQLILLKFHSFYFNFRSISKRKFDIICKYYFPLIFDRIKSLYLSDDDETSNLPKLLFLYSFTIHKFQYLHTLSIHKVQSFEVLNQILVQSIHLRCLTNLKLIQLHINYSVDEISCLINNIWNLSKLKFCFVSSLITKSLNFINLHNLSLSIKYLILENITCDCHDLPNLFYYTPLLEKLSVNLLYGFPNQGIDLQALKIKSLKLCYHGCEHILLSLFQHLPNLTILKLQMYENYIDGHRFEYIFKNHLIDVKVFQLKMHMNFHNCSEIDHIINTFRTRFWLVERQWFVRCDWSHIDVFYNGTLYTLPYPFEEYFYSNMIYSQSTFPIERNDPSYDYVRILSYEYSENNSSEDFHFRFNNISHLEMNQSFNRYFWLCISSFDRLKSITVNIRLSKIGYEQLQNLLDHARNLEEIRFSKAKDLSMELCKLRSSSIRKIDFLSKASSNIRYFNDEECLLLISSPLIQRCQTILIAIERRSIIIEFINSLANLQSLVCSCKDDEYTPWNLSVHNDEFIYWLTTHLSLKDSITRDERENELVRIWIR